MHVSVIFPDLNSLLNEAAVLRNLTRAISQEGGENVSGPAGLASDNQDAIFGVKNTNTGAITNIITRYQQLSQTANSVNDGIANPFEQLSLLFNQSELININTKNMTIKIPMIFWEDINAYHIYLRQRADVNGKIAQERINLVAAVGDLCIQDFYQYENANEALTKGTTKEDCPIDIRASVKFARDFELLLDQINQNILILNEYRDFPFELYERIHVIDRYMAEISAIVNNFFGYISYWMLTNANRYSSYVDAIILIMNIIKTYQALIDFSINR
jgi:hypothetical protein